MQIEKIERGSTRGQLDVSYGLGKYLDFFVYGTGAVDVADGIRGKIYSQNPSDRFMALCLLCGRACGSDRRVPAAVYETGICALFQF